MISKKYRKSRKSRKSIKSRSLRQKRVIYKKKTISKRYKKKGGGIGNDIRTKLGNSYKTRDWVEYKRLVSILVNNKNNERGEFFTYLEMWWRTFEPKTKISLYECFVELVKPETNDVRANDYIIEIDRIFESHRINELINELFHLYKDGKPDDYENYIENYIEGLIRENKEYIDQVFYGYLNLYWDTFIMEKKVCLYRCFKLLKSVPKYHSMANDYITEIGKIFKHYKPNKDIDELTKLCKNRQLEDYERIVIRLMEDPEDPTRERVAVFYGYLFAHWKGFSEEEKKCLHRCLLLHQESAVQNWYFMQFYGDGKITPLNWDEPATRRGRKRSSTELQRDHNLDNDEI